MGSTVRIHQGNVLKYTNNCNGAMGSTVRIHQGNVLKYTNNCNEAMGGLEANIKVKSWNTERWNGLTHDSCKAADGPESSTYAGEEEKKEWICSDDGEMINAHTFQ